ncbi:MAG: GIY-YIG nuclease family protein [gamma proteobacterium symbiont of Lucinoma myriamae]|nr:GIY-YIG nuclease family protein [gamma proteobacterium symbiont of Lucinoma myriamae]MCU7818247.1 GIY-YIG nuclease family protein [gamma proteobacterium symbiont of Lucinoma myriamae]
MPEKGSPEKADDKKKNWLVYIILCSDDSLYTGITTDLQRRFEQHKNKTGAKYFYGRESLEIVFTEQGHNRSSASRREYEIKSYSRAEKIVLIKSEQ